MISVGQAPGNISGLAWAVTAGCVDESEGSTTMLPGGDLTMRLAVYSAKRVSRLHPYAAARFVVALCTVARAAEISESGAGNGLGAPAAVKTGVEVGAYRANTREQMRDRHGHGLTAKTLQPQIVGDMSG